MNKSVFKIFIGFSFAAAIIATILLCINALGLAFIGTDTSVHIHNTSPQGVLEDVGEALIKKIIHLPCPKILNFPQITGAFF